jgi:LemA protein
MNVKNHLILDYLKSLSEDLEKKGYDAAEQDAILDSIQHQIYELGGNDDLDTDGQLSILCQLDSCEDYPPAQEEGEYSEQETKECVELFQPRVAHVQKKISLTGTVLLSCVVLTGTLIFWGMGVQREIVQLQEEVKSSEAQVDNVLQRRYELIPNLVNTVKGYAQHEKELLTEVTRLRSSWASQSGSEKRQTQQQLEGALSRLLLVSEQYPQLKANEMFQNLMVALEGSENRITVERMRFNQSVQSYNSEIKKMPQLYIAQVMGATELEAYHEVNEAVKVVPTVEF